jgi:hypothetical protein
MFGAATFVHFRGKFLVILAGFSNRKKGEKKRKGRRRNVN